jgi:Ion channel
MPVLVLDATRRDFHVSGAQLVVGLVSILLVGVCVLFHYEALSRTSRILPVVRLPRRMRIVVLILAMLTAHVVEVWIFALAYWFLDAWPALGRLGGTFEEGALDFVYYSVVTYTTLGFGDILPRGAVRILTGTEALLGLGLITWTASFAFLEMQRDWAEFRKPPARG